MKLAKNLCIGNGSPASLEMNERRLKEQCPNDLQYTNDNNSYTSNENSRNNKFSHPSIIPISPDEMPASQQQQCTSSPCSAATTTCTLTLSFIDAKTNPVSTKVSVVNKVKTKDGTVSSSPTKTKESEVRTKIYKRVEDHGFRYPDAEDLKTKYLPKLKVELNELPYKIHSNNIDLHEQKRSRLLNVRITPREENIWSNDDSWYNDTAMNILLHW